jgi:hypothetical protein
MRSIRFEMSIQKNNGFKKDSLKNQVFLKGKPLPMLQESSQYH